MTFLTVRTVGDMCTEITSCGALGVMSLDFSLSVMESHVNIKQESKII